MQAVLAVVELRRIGALPSGPIDWADPLADMYERFILHSAHLETRASVDPPTINRNHVGAGPRPQAEYRLIESAKGARKTVSRDELVHKIKFGRGQGVNVGLIRGAIVHVVICGV